MTALNELTAINILPINAFTDNYIWAMVHDASKQVIVVDPGEAQPVIDFVNQSGLSLREIWITHKHHDHVGGVDGLTATFPDVKVVAHAEHDVNQTITVEEGSTVTAFGHVATVWHTAGHTENHLAYVLDIEGKHHVFCADTLFSGGCGRVFTGDMHAMYQSLQRLASLPDETLFYPAHEYTASNLTFGLYIEPDNIAMQTRLAEVQKLTAAGEPSLPTSLYQEKQINVFLRVAEESVVDSLTEKLTKKLTDKTAVNGHEPVEVFAQLRKLKDGF